MGVPQGLKPRLYNGIYGRPEDRPLRRPRLNQSFPKRKLESGDFRIEEKTELVFETNQQAKITQAGQRCVVNVSFRLAAEVRARRHRHEGVGCGMDRLKKYAA